MSTLLIIGVLVASIALLGILGLCGYMLIQLVKPQRTISTEDFVDRLSILNSIIDAAINTYETSIFNGLGNKGSITNNNFDNYYKAMTDAILEDIPNELIDGLKNYYTESAIYKFIGRKVRDYLITKIKTNINRQ